MKPAGPHNSALIKPKEQVQKHEITYILPMSNGVSA